ncbi:unnamed protein product, partial [Lampetra fluviatilis]
VAPHHLLQLLLLIIIPISVSTMTEATLGHPFAVVQRIYYPCVCAIGIPANLLTTLTLARRSCGLSKVTRTYLVALSVADSLTLVWLGVVDLTLLWLQPEPFWGAYPWCGLVTVLEYGAMFSSIWIIVAFTIERFLSVARPAGSGPRPTAAASRGGGGAGGFCGGATTRSRSRAALYVTLAVFAASYAFAVPGFWLNITEVQNVTAVRGNVTGVHDDNVAEAGNNLTDVRNVTAFRDVAEVHNVMEVWSDVTEVQNVTEVRKGGATEAWNDVPEVQGNLKSVRTNVGEVWNGVVKVRNATEVQNNVTTVQKGIVEVQNITEVWGNITQVWNDGTPEMIAIGGKKMLESSLPTRSMSSSSSSWPPPPPETRQSQRCHHNVSPYAEAIVWAHTLASGAVPFALVLILNGTVVWRLRSQAFSGPQGPLRAKTRRSVAILLAVSLAFVGLSLPRFVTYCLLRTMGPEWARDRNDFTRPLNVAADVAIMLHLANSAVNCFLYCLASAAFRAELVALLACRGCARGSGRKAVGARALR